MPVPPPSGALTVAFRVLCMRCVRRKATVPDHDCVWSPTSSKCGYCVAQKSTCAPMSWFLADEYETLIDAETSSNPDPAAIKAAAAEAVRVATLAAAQMPKFRSEFELSAYMESVALRNSVEDCLRRVRLAVTALHTEQSRASSLLEGAVAAVKDAGEEVKKVAVAVAAASLVKKRKRNEGEEDLHSSLEPTTSPELASVAINTHLAPIHTVNISGLLDSGKHSDLRIVCREESWNVHRKVLSTASSVFERMIDELPANVHPGVIDLTKYEPKIVEKMLRFIYQKDYDDGRGTVPLSESFAPGRHDRPIPSRGALITNINMFIIAKKFGLNVLMNFVLGKHEEALEELWDTPSFERSITLLYDSNMDEVCKRELRRATINIIARNAAVLLKNKTFRAILNRYGELATEVLSITVTEEN
ncbi:hypothetical protein V496_06113 [Pseudogymnoascus sp. VKM F-4515 (FW-2607)]|nr:hypothetical protein V496_06113 [Pseudogymnoascus sp. VKM F-4515 (FW-2607)]